MDTTNVKITPIVDSVRLEKIDDDTYFSEKYSNYISNSRMGLLKRKGPKKYQQGFDDNYNPSFKLGSAVHAIILQPEYFEINNDISLPTAKLGEVVEYLYKYYKQGDITDEQIIEASQKVDYFRDSIESKFDSIRKAGEEYWAKRLAFEQSYTGNKEMIYLSDSMRKDAYGCIKALGNNRRVQSLLHPLDAMGNHIISENEQAILIDVEAQVDDNEPFIMKLKAKIDNYTIDPINNVVTVNDVKTTFADTRKFDDVIQCYSYYREISFYIMLLRLCMKKYYNLEKPHVFGNFLVVSTHSPYYTCVVPMTEKLFMQGIDEYKDLLKQIAWHTQYGFDEPVNKYQFL